MLLVFGLSAGSAIATGSKPFTPADLDAVVFELSDAARVYRPPLVSDVDERLAAAAQAIRHFQQSGNPRDLSTAERLVKDVPHPGPVEARMIRAYITQAQHDFDGARKQLEAVVDDYPHMAPAWTMLADVYRVTGRLELAEHACQKRVAIAPDAGGLVCLASVLGLTGEGDKAKDLLRSAATALPSTHPMQSWIRGTRAELAVRENDLDLAAQLYAKAMQVDDPPLYLVAEYVDVLLQRNQPEKALVVLERHPENSALLVRKAVALRTIGRNEWRAVDKTLQELFELEQRRGDGVHLRERAAWALYVRHNPQEALQSATRNFTIQKEPEDVRLLMAAAEAANDPTAAEPAVRFLEKYRPEQLTGPADIRLEGR